MIASFYGFVRVEPGGVKHSRDVFCAQAATRLPRRLEENMKIVGEQIKLARLRRNLSRAQVDERAMCSELTEARVEKGSPTVAIGIYLRVLYALQLEDDILFIAKEDKLGKELQDIAMINRERASKK